MRYRISKCKKSPVGESEAAGDQIKKNVTARGRELSRKYGLLLPHRLWVLSEMCPIRGSVIASQNLPARKTKLNRWVPSRRVSV